MKIGKEFLEVLNKRYSPLSVIETSIGKHDITLKTNTVGDPVLLFSGKRNHHGKISGERFARTIEYDNEGNIIKDHWERKGKAS